MLEAWSRWASIERGLSPRTIAEYRREIARLGPDAELLTTSKLRELLYELGGQPSTVSRRIAAWRSYFGFLVRTGVLVGVNPAISLDRPKVSRGLPRPVSDLEARLGLLEPEFRAIAVLMSETGLRISEACAIDVGLPVPSDLVVHGKGSKDRVVPLSAAARAALTLLDGRVRWGPRTIQRRFAEVGFSPHRLRHTFATELADADVDLSVVQQLLGHESPSTTMIYMKNSAERLRRGIERRRDAPA